MSSSLKCFHERIFLAADGMARMVDWQSRGSWRKVSSWQWSGLSCEMSMISGSWSSSSKEEMHGSVLCSDTEKKLPRMVAGPVSQGSMSTVKEVGNRAGEDGEAAGGLKVSRNAVSPFRDLTVSDMFARRQAPGSGRMYFGGCH